MSWLPWHATHCAMPRLRKAGEWALRSKSVISVSWQRPHAWATEDESGGADACAPWQPVQVGAFTLPLAKACPWTLFCHLEY